MEYLQTFNEHQKRKFKSFQKEKQDAIDKKEEEERWKSYGSNINTTTPTYNNSSYIYWRDREKSAQPRKKTYVYISTTAERRESLEGRPRIVFEEALKDLYPGTEVRNLPEACIWKEAACNFHGITTNRDYDLEEVSPQETSRNIIIITNDKGGKITLGGGIPDRFRMYKKYPFDVYASPRETYTKGNNMAVRKSYKLIGETEENFEITDDKGVRKSYPKFWFGLPYKMNKTGSKIISRTEADLYYN